MMGKRKGGKKTPKEVKWARRAVRLGFGAAGGAVAAAPIIDAATKSFVGGKFDAQKFIDWTKSNYGFEPNGEFHIDEFVVNAVALPFLGGVIAKIGGRIAKQIN